MKKLLIECQHLNLTFSNQKHRKAERILASQRKMYAEISEKEKRISSVKDNKFYKAQYQELGKKYAEAKKELETDMRKQEEIISIFEAIK